MRSRFDVIVAGLGAMGSAAAFHLSRAGKMVLGLDRFAPPHPFGSSHGESRIIREAYFEDPAYVPLVQRAYDLWHELEKLAGQPILKTTGGLMIGAPESVVFNGARTSAQRHHLPHEILSAAEVRKRFPALLPEDGMLAVWEPRAGVLFPERCIAAHLHHAQKLGATIRLNEPLLRWNPVGNGVTVATAAGEFTADHLILSAGAWMPALLPEMRLQVERQVMFWFKPVRRPEFFSADGCPVHLWEWEQERFFYGLPDLGTGVKVACHHEGAPVSPDQVDRTVAAEEMDRMRRVVQRFLPDANGELISSVVCLYTNTPDGHFLIDHHPENDRVILASPCSGHGFKFSSAVGEVLKRMVCGEPIGLDLRLFRRKE